MNKKPILTGDRPTGKLHLGHYLGSLVNRLSAQDHFDCFFVLANLHTLTTKSEKGDIESLKDNIFQTVVDYLAVGIDPIKSTIFVQSGVPQTCELYTILGMLVNVPRLRRMLSLKEMAEAANLTTIPFGLLEYPVLMAADILLSRANLVPVGVDNQPNVEFAREIASRFNHYYGNAFPIPEPQEESTHVGTDGQAKMSKSLGIAIYLSDQPATVEQKVMGMYTDPNRIRADTPGRVKGNPIFIYHDYFNANKDEVDELIERYRKGQVGDVEVKRKMTRAINDFLGPFRQKHADLLADPERIYDILAHGSKKMVRIARETMELVRDAMGMRFNFKMEVKY